MAELGRLAWSLSRPSPDVAVPSHTARFGYYLSRDRSKFVERWKVIRERNMNLPNLDFNDHSTKFPRKLIDRGPTMTRSSTQHDMRLPSMLPNLRRNPPFSVPGTALSFAPNHLYEQSPKSNVKIQNVLQQQGKVTASILSTPNSQMSASTTKQFSSTATPFQTEKYKFQKIVDQKKLTIRNSSHKGEKTKTIPEHKLTKPVEETSIYHLDLKSNASSREYSAKSVKNLTNDDIWTLIDQSLTGRKAEHKPWKDKCKCIRCEIFRRQFIEKNKHFVIFGQYPLNSSPKMVT